MVSAGDFKKGSTKILLKNDPWVVLDFTHVKPGKGGAFVRTKVRNLRTGVIYEETFRSGEKLEEPDIEYKTMQFLYQDDLYNFMDEESFEQSSFSEKELGGAREYLKEGVAYKMIYFQGSPITVEPPTFMELKVTETVPGVRGNSAQGGVTKPATMETGVVINVPLFVCEGEVIKVDTRTGEYIERVV